MNPAERATEHIPPPDASSAPEGANAMLTGDAAAGLDDLTVLRVTGTDALSWLQGQLTADVSEVGASTSRLAAWCSPKGRVLALFRLFADPAGGYRAVCERWLAETLLARLRMYILRAEVRVDDAGDALTVAGVAGVRALPDRLAAWASTAAVDDAEAFEDTTIARVPGRHARFLVVGPPARIGSITAARMPPRMRGGIRPTSPGVGRRTRGPGTDPEMPGGVRTAGAAAWRLADICAGVPRIPASASDAFLPQMLNLDRLGAVSFEKGCYVGQEIVARTHHLGRVKRRAHVGRTAAAAEGDPIVDTGEDGAPKVGEVVAAEPHPDGGSVAFAVLNTASASSPALRVGGPDGAPIRIASPDYVRRSD